MGLRSFIRECQSFYRFRSLPSDAQPIVFYAEDASSWQYLEPIISELINTYHRNICYITSSHADPILKSSKDGIQSFCIGLGTVRTIFFATLQVDVMVMTMPDLGNYHIKRSKHPVLYLYVYHSIVSTHMAYREGAFDQYDQIICVGPHHKSEIRAYEALHSLKPKTLLDGGYVILDSIIREACDERCTRVTGTTHVLVAPSWGKNGLIESCGVQLVDILLGAGFRVTVRPHSMTIRQKHPALSILKERFDFNSNFCLDIGLASQGTVSDADLMISDWSGAALEYALGLGKPVIFVDVPKKINNPNYEEIANQPIEIMLRAKIGEVISPSNLSEIPCAVDRLCEESNVVREKISELRSDWVYNIGSAAEATAGHIVRAADAKRK